MIRVIFDTNVLISATLLRHSVSRQAFDQAINRSTVLSSLATLAEIMEVIRRPQFDRYVTIAERREFLSALIRNTTLIAILASVAICRDPKDNKFLELAVNGQADFVVSGDNDLLVLHPFRGVKIVTPRDFLMLSDEDPPVV